MFQNLLLTSLTPLLDKNEIHCWENRPFTSTWPESRQEKSEKPKVTDIKRPIKKKPKRVRTSFSTDQLQLLENAFSRNRYINAESRRDLASCLKIEEKTIKVWFQNRRMKEKRDSSDSNCDSSSETFTKVSSSPPIPIGQYQATEFSVKPFQYNFETNHSEINHLDTAHYQLPNSVYNNYNPTEEYRNQGPYNTIPETSFGYDVTSSNVYPSQYYPVGSGYYTNIGSGHSYSNSNENNNWSSGFDLSYF